MTTSKSALICILTALVALAPASSVRAEEATADVRVRIPASPAPRAELRRAEIFEILKGGSDDNDVRLDTHLWQVAGSLAARQWTPPRVIVQVVVRESDSK